MRVLIAPDSFKGSIGAAQAAEAIASGWRRARPGDKVRLLPLADGGEGTLEVLAAGPGACRWHEAPVTGPGGDPVTSCWLELPDGTHAVELAQASGLPLLAAADPMGAQTTGTGELIGAALDLGARAILVGLGGSASTDGGTAALAALGARFLDARGHDLPSGGGGLARLASADLSGLRPAPPGGVTCLTDVRAPLLGPAGAAAVFGPQKGAGPAQIAALERGLAALAAQLGGDPQAPGAGAAGGTAYGLAAAWGATIAAGAAQLCRIAGLGAALDAADLVITGEGRYDATSRDGKVTGTVCAAAAARAVPAALIAGQLADVPPEEVRLTAALADLAGGTAAATREPARWLAAAAATIALDITEAAEPGGLRT
ncbi:MAG: glycerate kinase [Streptosporangiaceae bacterium]|jgi:glycerate kinase